MSSQTVTWERIGLPLWRAAAFPVRALQVGMSLPSILYLAAMTVFLFRPPDLFSFYADRIALAALIFFIALRTLMLRNKIPFFPGISLPMLGLMALAIFRALRDPFDAQVWSIVASKFIVPFALFHIAVLVFRDSAERKHFEIYTFLALAYLVFIAIAFLINCRSLIFPRFILDESLGFHPERARGPFLQPVANGVSLNILGILLISCSLHRNTIVRSLCLILPLAILATMTRAVWIAFGASIIVLGYRMVERRLQFVGVVLATAGLLAGLAIGVSSSSLTAALSNRAEESGPVDARLAVYEAGWSMFKEKPFNGWPASGMYTELARRMNGYHLHAYYVHNTYLALLVEFGIPGLIIYVLLFFNLFRLSWRGPPNECSSVASLRNVWPIVLCVYLFNAFFVDMAYQFVIGLVFTVAGMLCASEEARS